MRHEQLSVGELEVDSITGAGIELFSRKKIYLDPTAGSDGNDGLTITRAKKTLAAALGRITTGKSDTIIWVQGASHLSLSADPAWSYNLTNLVGNAGPGMVNKRCKITMASDYGSPALTISGYGNVFANLFHEHGFGATKVALQGVAISGHYNTFKGVHFGGPLNDTLGADASYRGVVITGINSHFDHCVFGFDTIDRTGANSLVSLGPNTMTTFEDCIFLTRISGTTPYFFEVLNTSAVTRAFFKRCQFIALSTNMAVTMAEAFNFTGGSTCAMVFDSECTFMKVTKIAATGSYGYIWVPAGAAADKMTSVILS